MLEKDLWFEHKTTIIKVELPTVGRGWEMEGICKFIILSPWTFFDPPKPFITFINQNGIPIQVPSKYACSADRRETTYGEVSCLRSLHNDRNRG